jgi:hypothetical protein
VSASEHRQELASEGDGREETHKKTTRPRPGSPHSKKLEPIPCAVGSLLLRFKPRYRVEFQFETPLSDNGRKSDSPTRGYLPKEEGSSARAFFLP